ncbi:MAG TPA: sulfatase-like hydrolase/transferase [Bryobacteraceae bacterium]
MKTGLLANCIRQVLVWLPVAMATLYLKLWTIIHGTFKSAGMPLKEALHLGLQWASLAKVSPADRPPLVNLLSLVRAELWWSFVVVPVVLCLCVALGRPLVQRWLLAAVGILILAVVYIQAQSFALLGRFQPWQLIVEGWDWGVRDPRSSLRYLNVWGLFWLAAGIAAVVVLAAMPARLLEKYIGAPLAHRRRLGYGGLIGLAMICGAAWLPWMPTTNFHKFASNEAIETLLASPVPRGYEAIAGLTPDQLRARYRALAKAPPAGEPSPYFGQARGYDVLLFVIETMPAKAVPVDGDLAPFPHVAGLKPQAWIAASHHSTYPLTIRALFSIFTGMYPPDSPRNTWRVQTETKQGLMQNLRQAGYATAVYGSVLSIAPNSGDTFAQFGFTRIRSFPKAEVAPDPSIPVTEQTERLRRLSALDRSALAELKRDMEGWIDHNQRYAAAYLPQISHGPWDDVSRDGKERNLLKRGQNLSTLLDGWLGELLDVLQRKGRLERTLIVVTGDHGLRDWAEAPSRLFTLMDDYAFHVPLLLYAPGVLKHSERIDYVTSHIDIAPSILDLVGVSGSRERQQGAPMWDARLASRQTYLWGNQFIGNDGMYSNGVFYGWNRVADVVYANRQFHFEPGTEEPRGSTAERYAMNSILQMSAIQMAWFRR